jgi:hypothetical protein
MFVTKLVFAIFVTASNSLANGFTLLNRSAVPYEPATELGNITRSVPRSSLARPNDQFKIVVLGLKTYNYTCISGNRSIAP